MLEGDEQQAYPEGEAGKALEDERNVRCFYNKKEQTSVCQAQL